MFRNEGFQQRRNSAPVNVGDELDVKIEAVGEKGDGIAKKDGFVLFVPGVNEGDEVRIRVTKVLRKVGFAEVVGEGTTKSEKEPLEEAAAEPTEQEPVEGSSEEIKETETQEEPTEEKETTEEKKSEEEKPEEKKETVSDKVVEDTEDFGEDLEEEK